VIDKRLPVTWEMAVPNYRRLFAPGACYFFTVVTAGRAPIFATDVARKCLRHAFLKAKARWPFRVLAIVLLPDHLHTIWSLPSGDSGFSRRWAWIKRAFSQEWIQAGGLEHEVSPSKEGDRRHGVWQRRFWEHVIRNELDFERHCDYIHYNPVKHGLVRCAREWPHSSFHRFVLAGDYPQDWGCGLILPPSPNGLDETAME
jgi:putative transposase